MTEYRDRRVAKKSTRTSLLTVALAVFVGIAVIATTAIASSQATGVSSASVPTGHLSGGDPSAVQPPPHPVPGSKPVVRAHASVVNDVDSGYNGYWAIDNYTLHIQIWQEPNGTFLFVLTYQGTSTTYPGVYSPGAQDAVEGAHGVARMEGYIAGWASATFAPTHPTKGQLGTYDYGGQVSDLTTVNHYGNGAAPPNAIDWLGAYLSGNTVSGESYALVYTYHADASQAPGAQVWIDANNVPSAESGDIVL